MSAPRFTPGPWRLGVDDPCNIFAATGNEEPQIATAHRYPDAALIAAAPELYAALVAYMGTHLHESSDEPACEAWELARAALKKARGEP